MKHKAGSGNVPVFHCFIYPVLDVHFKFHEKVKLTEDNKKKMLVAVGAGFKEPICWFFYDTVWNSLPMDASIEAVKVYFL